MFPNNYRKFEDLMEEVLHNFSSYRVALFSTMAWSLWQRRNKLREKKPTWSLHKLGGRAKELVLEFLDANKKPPWSTPRHDQVRWIPPSEQNYKGNFDAALFDDSGCAGVKSGVSGS